MKDVLKTAIESRLAYKAHIHCLAKSTLPLPTIHVLIVLFITRIFCREPK